MRLRIRLCEKVVEGVTQRCASRLAHNDVEPRLDLYLDPESRHELIPHFHGGPDTLAAAESAVDAVVQTQRDGMKQLSARSLQKDQERMRLLAAWKSGAEDTKSRFRLSIHTLADGSELSLCRSKLLLLLLRILSTYKLHSFPTPCLPSPHFFRYAQSSNFPLEHHPTQRSLVRHRSRTTLCQPMRAS